MLGALLLSGVFGTVTAIAAHSRGRNSLLWLVLGMVIGPFALVVALLPSVARERVTMACPHCAEVVPWAARVCRYCHGVVEAPELSGRAPRGEVAAADRYLRQGLDKRASATGRDY